MYPNLSTAALTLSLLILGATGCAAPPAERMYGVVGSPGQAAATTGHHDTSIDQPVTNATHMPTALQTKAQASLQAAEEAYARGDWVAAAREFKAITPAYPRNGQVWFGLGAASALSGNLDEASSAFETALRIDPRDARASYNLSLIRLSQAEVALGNASANATTAPAPVQVEIARLSRELGPVFNRSSGAKPVATAPSATSKNFRMQDPAREPRAAAASGMTGAYAATPIIPSAAAAAAR